MAGTADGGATPIYTAPVSAVLAQSGTRLYAALAFAHRFADGVAVVGPVQADDLLTVTGYRTSPASRGFALDAWAASAASSPTQPRLLGRYPRAPPPTPLRWNSRRGK